jgi:hypothetical protein
MQHIKNKQDCYFAYSALEIGSARYTWLSDRDYTLSNDRSAQKTFKRYKWWSQQIKFSKHRFKKSWW